MDYRISDPYLDPPGMFEECYAEKTYRLPHTFWCYDPLCEAPEVGQPAVVDRGSITFGCLNNFCKVNEQVLELWAGVLREVADSRLILLTPGRAGGERVKDFMAKHGVAGERVSCVSARPRKEYLALYREIDIVLDTVPYNGHTTSLDALWMGVPVVSLVGETVVGRAGVSQLTNLELSDLVARDEQEFVRMAVRLASDVARLGRLRGELRGRMERSPLRDAERFARDMEAAYRWMWGEWCRGIR
jgi:predicted O-linked N-acetylglucosamine transferase (SPINDLY family)